MSDPPSGGPSGRFRRRPPFSAAVLAGGRSSRMGTDKALLPVGGAGMLERAVAVLRPLAAEVFVVAGDAGRYRSLGLPVHRDLVAGAGPLGGILTALARAAHPLVLCVACDMPFLSAEVVGLLVGAARPGDDAVLPVLPGGAEPLCAVYARTLRPRLEREVRAGRLRIVDALSGARVRRIDAAALDGLDAGRSFLNVNTPAELAAARRIAGGEAP